jgi:lysozyme family protein
MNLILTLLATFTLSSYAMLPDDDLNDHNNPPRTQRIPAETLEINNLKEENERMQRICIEYLLKSKAESDFNRYKKDKEEKEKVEKEKRQKAYEEQQNQEINDFINKNK